MQSGCRRRHGSRTIRKNRLVTLAVRRFVLARNVGWQRDVAKAFDRLGNVFLRSQSDSPEPIFAATDHFGGEFSVSKFNALSHPNFSSGPDLSFPLPRSD